jgi:hypothetical protein
MALSSYQVSTSLLVFPSSAMDANNSVDAEELDWRRSRMQL